RRSCRMEFGGGPRAGNDQEKDYGANHVQRVRRARLEGRATVPDQERQDRPSGDAQGIGPQKDPETPRLKRGGKGTIDPSQLHTSDVESPIGNRISCARAGPPGSLPKSTRNRSLSLSPPFSASASSCSISDPCLAMVG